MDNMVSIVGHRGGLGLWPENTIAGFRKAAALGVDFVELDVQLSSDGEVMVMHDHTLDRTTMGTGTVSSKTAAELVRIPIRNGDGECVSTLDTVLAAMKPETVGIAIELKTDPLSAPYPALQEKVLELVDKHGLRPRVRFVSFVPEALERMRELWPQAPVVAVFHRATLQMLGGVVKGFERFRTMPGCIIHVERTLQENCYELCLDLVEPGCLGVGPVNSEDDLRLWLPRPMSQLASDFPDRAVAMRRELGLA
jgi:glycerophosphoryl diester phosphodiesterase